MAKINKKSKRVKEQESKKLIGLWFEDKIVRIRSFSKHYASRASRFGAPAGVALLAFFVIYSLFLPKDRLQIAKERLVKNPNDLKAHLILAEEYLKNNQLDEVERELLIVDSRLQTADGDEQVLGEASLLEPENWLLKTKQLWQKKQESDPEDIRQLIKYWEQIISEKPDYRDSYLQLALLHYKLYENEKAQEYLKKALELDPNFEPVQELEKILGD